MATVWMIHHTCERTGRRGFVAEIFPTPERARHAMEIEAKLGPGRRFHIEAHNPSVRMLHCGILRGAAA